VDRKPEMAQKEEVLVEDAETMWVRGLMRRGRSQNHQNPKQLAHNQDGCQKRLAIACRRMNHHAKVARQVKENNKKKSSRTRITWRKRSIVRRNCIRIKDDERIRRLRKSVDSPRRKNGNKGHGRQTAAMSEEKCAKQERHLRV
jgi:hypothetical protein